MIEALKQSKPVISCKAGDIIAEDILINGVKLLGKDTLLNNYIINKLRDNGIYKICTYNLQEDLNLEDSSIILSSLTQQYKLYINAIRDIFKDLVTKNEVDYDTIGKLAESISENLKNSTYIVQCLTSLRETDEYTYSHSLNVAFYCMLTAKWMNMSMDEILEIIKAALLHDIGKMKVPNEILNKPGRLSSSEFDEMKKHTIFGYDIINDCDEICRNVKQSILMHHERTDGSGYPFGKVDEEIPTFAKIIAIADVFDAMTSNRVYKRKTTPFSAFQMFYSEGLKLFDIKIMHTFMEKVSVYYIGMKVKLNNEKEGEIVYIPPKDILYPIVRIDDEFIDFRVNKELCITDIYN